jgi:hypothetical protein
MAAGPLPDLESFEVTRGLEAVQSAIVLPPGLASQSTAAF